MKKVIRIFKGVNLLWVSTVDCLPVRDKCIATIVLHVRCIVTENNWA